MGLSSMEQRWNVVTGLANPDIVFDTGMGTNGKGVGAHQYLFAPGRPICWHPLSSPVASPQDDFHSYEHAMST